MVIWVDFALEPCVKHAMGTELPPPNARSPMQLPQPWCVRTALRGQAEPAPCRLLSLGAVPGEEASEEEQATPAPARLSWDTTGDGPPQTAEGASPHLREPGREEVVIKVHVESCRPGQPGGEKTNESLFVCGPHGVWVGQ